MNEINQIIASRLKKLRQEKQWSLDKTAEMTGVSKAMLGQIERLESSPTIATLWKIANGFNTSFSQFLTEWPEKKSQNLSLAQSSLSDISNDKIHISTLFAYDHQLQCEIFKIDLLPGCEHLSLPHQEQVIEHILVLEGTLEVYFDHQWHALKKGQAIQFNAHQPHGYRNLTSKPSSFYNLIHYL